MTDRTDNKAVVTEIQKMLRHIALGGGNIPLINPDGIYGGETAAAVRTFQRSLGLPSTGKADFATWNALKLASDNAKRKNGPGESISPFPSPDYVVSPGEASSMTYLVQIILDALSIAFDGLEGLKISGKYDGDTESRVKLFQHYCGMDQTGKVDKRTWDAMAKSYNALADNRSYI